MEHFEKLNWLLINQRFKQSVTSTVFKFVQNKCTAYMNEVFRTAENIRINTRKSCLKLNHPFRKTNNLNTFKFKMKHHYLNDLIQTYEILVDLIMLWLS